MQLNKNKSAKNRVLKICLFFFCLFYSVKLILTIGRIVRRRKKEEATYNYVDMIGVLYSSFELQFLVSLNPTKSQYGFSHANVHTGDGTQPRPTEVNECCEAARRNILFLFCYY